MTTFQKIHWVGFVLAFLCLSQISSAQEKMFANQQISETSGVICALCDVDFPEAPIDNDFTNASELQVELGILDAYAGQTLIFPKEFSQGDQLTLVLGVDQPDLLLQVGLITNITFETSLGEESNNDKQTMLTSIVTILNEETGVFELKITPDKNFDRVTVRLEAIIGSVLNEAKVYGAYIQKVEAQTDGPVSTSTEVGGAVCLLCTIENPDAAIDKNPTTGSSLKVAVGFGATNAFVNQTFKFNSPACGGSDVFVHLRQPDGIVELTLLGNVHFESSLNGVPNDDVSIISQSNFKLLEAGNEFIVTFNPGGEFDEIKVQLNGGPTAFLSELQILDVSRGGLPSPRIMDSEQNLCFGENAVLNASTPEGSTTNWFIQYDLNNPIATGNVLELTNLSGKNIFYAQTVDTTSNCKSTYLQPVYLNVAEPFLQTEIGTETIAQCDGQPTVLGDPNKSAVYSFFSDSSLNDLIHYGTSLTVEPVTEAESIFVVGYNSQTGCVSNNVAQVKVAPGAIAATPVIIGDSVACGRGTVLLTAQADDGSTSFTWWDKPEGGSIIYTTQEVSYDDFGDPRTFYVENNKNLCGSERVKFTVSTVERLEPTTDVYCIANNNNAITFVWESVENASGYEISEDGFEWFPVGNETSFTFENLDSKELVTLYVHATADYDCQTSEMSYAVSCEASEIIEDTIGTNKPLTDVFAPNLFTPNGDYLNDLYLVTTPEKTQAFSIQIFNEWGEVIFQSKDALTGWDGTYRGVQQPKGVYVYMVDVVNSDGTREKKSGNLTLIR